MAEGISTPPPAAARAGGGGPVRLRTMRVESDFRRETRFLQRQERDKYANWMWNLMRLERAPKVLISDVVGARQDAPVDFHHEDSFNLALDYYRAKPSHTELIAVLKFYAVYLMQQARKERAFDKQLFLLFKAVDFLRMLVQYSSFGTNADAETLVLCIFTDLADARPQFQPYAVTEQRIYRLMKQLRAFPADHRVRLEMADEMVKQTSFYDALVQYQVLNRLLPRMPRAQDTRRGVAFHRIAGIFENLIGHAGQGLQDGRKLRNFNDRYNRDYAERGHRLVPPPRNQPGRLGPTVQSLREAAIRWYLRALPVRTLGAPRLTEIVMALGTHYDAIGRTREALKVMTDGYAYWRRVPGHLAQLRRRVAYLDFVATLGVKLKQRGAVTWANNELREHRTRLDQLETEQRQRKQRREAILGGDLEVEEAEEAEV